MKDFKKILPENIEGNSFQMIGKQWFLIVAGNNEKHNCMTAAWGGFGILWKVPVVYIFVRPTRYTNSFIEKNTKFSLCFFDDKYKDILNICGTKSGRDIDKMNNIGLTSCFTENNTPCYKESSLILECNKIYYDLLKPENFLSTIIEKNYPLKDYHYMYVGEIINVFEK